MKVWGVSREGVSGEIGSELHDVFLQSYTLNKCLHLSFSIGVFCLVTFHLSSEGVYLSEIIRKKLEPRTQASSSN